MKKNSASSGFGTVLIMTNRPGDPSIFALAARAGSGNAEGRPAAKTGGRPGRTRAAREDAPSCTRRTQALASREGPPRPKAPNND